IVCVLVVLLGILAYVVIDPLHPALFYAMAGLGLLIGVLMVLRIGGADMPVVISLLNSYAGLASAATGLVLDNNVLVIAGALDGASGFILSIMMSRAMNRSFTNVLFGAFGGESAGGSAGPGAAAGSVRAVGAEDRALQAAPA